MEAAKARKLVKLGFTLFAISSIAGIIELYVTLFPNLALLFNAPLQDGIGKALAPVPVWPAVLMAATIFVWLFCARRLYKFVVSKI